MIKVAFGVLVISHIWKLHDMWWPGSYLRYAASSRCVGWLFDNLRQLCEDVCGSIAIVYVETEEGGLGCQVFPPIHVLAVIGEAAQA